MNEKEIEERIYSIIAEEIKRWTSAYIKTEQSMSLVIPNVILHSQRRINELLDKEEAVLIGFKL